MANLLVIIGLLGIVSNFHGIDALGVGALRSELALLESKFK